MQTGPFFTDPDETIAFTTKQVFWVDGPFKCDIYAFDALLFVGRFSVPKGTKGFVPSGIIVTEDTFQYSGIIVAEDTFQYR